MKMKRTVAGRAAARFDLPAEAVSAAPRITVSGGDRVLVEGHRALLEYASGRVAAAGAGCTVVIEGEALRLRAMRGRELVVTGRIWAVQLV